MNKDFKIALILTVVVIGFGVSVLNGQPLPGLDTAEERAPEEQREYDESRVVDAIREYDEAKAERTALLSIDNYGVATQYGLTRLTAENTRETAENTRETSENTAGIFWVLVAGFVAWGIRSYKTGK